MIRLPLAAADWFEILFFLFIVTSSLIGQAVKVAQERRQAKKKAERMGGNRADLGQPKKPAGRGLEAEIEDFLSQVTGKKKEQPRPRQADRPPVKQVVSRSQPSQSKSTQPPQRTQRSKPPQQVRAELVRPAKPPTPPAVTPFPAHESISQHLQRHMREGSVSQYDAPLAESISMSDERLEGHLHDVFDHRVGHLGEEHMAGIEQGTDAAAWSKNAGLNASPLAQQIRRMLASPESIGAAVVLSEILRRPEERWDD